MSVSPRILRPVAIVGALGAVIVGVVACGSSLSTSTPASTAAASTASTATAMTTPAKDMTAADGASAAPSAASSSTAAATTVPVTLGSPTEFALVLGASKIMAGKVTFDVVNKGKMLHELGVLKTSTPGAKLKVMSGQADDSSSIGETGDMMAGSTMKLALNIKPGHYVVLCNQVGHYQGGMWKDLTVSSAPQDDTRSLRETERVSGACRIPLPGEKGSAAQAPGAVQSKPVAFYPPAIGR